MELLDLPVEILYLLPSHLHNIEDFTNTSSTCRTLRTAFSKTHQNTILGLAATSIKVFFRPDSHFLIAATARQLASWALQSPANTAVLRNAFTGGVDSLLALCLDKCGLTMEEIRRLYETRFSTLNPVADFIDQVAGVQWYDVPDFWNGGRSDAFTIMCEPERAMYQFIIYGELFASTMDAHLRPSTELPRFDLETRLDYVRYCIPDVVCLVGNPSIEKPLRIGPYRERTGADNPVVGEDQTALNHVLNCRRWREAWEGVRREVGGDFETEWKQDMWASAVECQGLNGLEMIRPGGVERWRSRLEKTRSEIEELEPCPQTYKFGERYQNPATEYPCMRKEVFLLMAGMWQW